MLRLFKLIVVLLVAVIGLGFATLNLQSVTVDFYFFRLDLALALVVGLALGAGVLLGIIASTFMLLRAKSESAEYRRQVRIADQEVRALRVMPMKDR